jgi:hypothetical protein
VFIEESSTEYICIPMTGPQGDLSGYAGEVALIPPAQAENGGPVEADWKTASWIPVPGGRKELALMYTPGSYPPGEYVAYGRLTADPEKPVRKSGRVQIGHG